MKANSLVLAQRYAKAYDGIAKNADEAAKNLSAYKDALAALTAADNALANPTLPFSVKEELLVKILDKSLATSFIKLLVSAKRFDLAPEILRQLQQLLDKRLGIKRVHIASATPLEEPVKQKLNEALSKYFNSRLEIDFTQEAALLAGITLRERDTLIDGSALGRIEELAKNLTGV
ncbi:MAG: ATP synthase F1 subunit delta [Elusimicrobiota bacterium]|jgi:F-type H+-transporting ATPase subunit delta|nr:ATP synthase F1 subunit delta [Elusimicrobiota bacterium]